jgi:adenosylmethionine-8-amino-7-oxononanoate aminotransferase
MSNETKWTKEILEDDKKYVWHPYTQEMTAPPSLAIKKAEGPYLITGEGRKIFDVISSWWVNLHGHGNPHIMAAIREQCGQIEQIIFADCTHEKGAKLARKIVEALPGQFSKVFYSDNGSTAVEIGIKMAIQYWSNQGKSKNKVVAFRNSFHGETFGSMSVSDVDEIVGPFEEHKFKTLFVNPPLEGRPQQIKEALENFEHLLKVHHEEIGLFLFEPLVQGVAGMMVQDKEALDEMIRIARKYNVLTMADEVFTGFGRTGKMFAMNHLQETPDIVALAKGLTGGVIPLAATVVTDKVYREFYSPVKEKAFFHGHSFCGNALGAAAALANLELFEKPETLGNIERITALHQGFKEELEKNPEWSFKIVEVRQFGTILAIELQTEEESGYLNPIRDRIFNYFMDRDVLMRPLGNVFYMLPPYCTSTEIIEDTYQMIRDFLTHEV